MASKTQPTISIKLLIDQERNKVILVEAGNDFVDTLRSLLTLPLGNIARLVHKHQSSRPGCLNNPYNSVQNLGLNSFRTEACKSMLLYPRSIHQDKSKYYLKLPMDITEPTRYFVCEDLTCGRFDKSGGLFSYYETSRCSCGKLMNREISVKGEERDAVEEESESEGVLESMFLLTDNLRVMKGLPGHLLNFLSDSGIKDVNRIAVKVLKSHSLFSKTTLSDVFLRKQGILSTSPMLDEQFVLGASTENDGKTSVNMILRKSDKKILYAEASEDFVDLQFSVLSNLY